MKKQVVSVLLAAMVGAFALAGCGNNAQTAGSVAESTQVESTQAATSEEAKESTVEETANESSEDADQKAADKVAELIDAIYVQQRTDDTDKQCEEAKAAGFHRGRS